MSAYNKPVAVLIPFYKTTLTNYECIALQQCFKVLAGHPVVAVKPYQLNLPAEAQDYPFAGIVSFDDDFFADIRGYNRLLLSAYFYKAFLSYKHILIYQLDAFVFKDRLMHWCNQKIDYIGAPWIKSFAHPDIVKTVKSNLMYYFHTRNNVFINGEPSKYQWENRVGNGGFSLRCVERFYELCLNRKADIDYYLHQDNYHFNEDRFWSVEVNRKHRELNIPGYKVGLQFSVEFHPARALIINKGQLPFGCHAWDRNLDFWRPIFQKQGYVI